MSLLQNVEGQVKLAAGVDLAKVKEYSLLFVTKLKEVGDIGDQVTLSHILLLQEKGWKVGDEANFQGLREWVNTVYQGNKTFFNNVERWLKANCGLLIEIRDNEGEGQEGTRAIITHNKGVDCEALNKALPNAIAMANKQGILYKEAPKKAPKAGSAGKGGSKNSNAISVSEGQVIAEKLGLAAALEGDSKETERLEEVAQYIVRILEHAKYNPDRNNLKALLESTCKKLDNGFNLASAMAKAVV